MLMLSNANAKQFLSNVTPSTYLQYADHTDRASQLIGVKGRKRKEEKKKRKEKKRKRRFLELPRPKAGS